MPRLIINADDYGYTAGIDATIEALAAAGALSSTTAMAVALRERAGEPAGLGELGGRMGMGVGCHVVLLDGEACAGEAVPSLLAGGPGLRPTLGGFVAALLAGRMRAAELEAEAVAQMRSLQALGVRLTHFDTHKHTHLFPAVLRPLLLAARRCGIAAVRNPFEPAWARAATPHAPALRRAQLGALAGLEPSFLREVERAGLRTTAGALGVLATGTLDVPTLERLLEALERHGARGACYELVCHPGVHDAALAARATRLKAERELERAALLEVIPGWVRRHPGKLVSFAEL